MSRRRLNYRIVTGPFEEIAYRATALAHDIAAFLRDGSVQFGAIRQHAIAVLRKRNRRQRDAALETRANIAI